MILPKNWDEVLLDQYILLGENKEEEYDKFDNDLRILSILTDTLPEDEVWESMDIVEFIKLVSGLEWINHPPTNDFKRDLDGFSIIPIEKITLGEFIDLDSLFSSDYIENLSKIVGIFYRKTREDEWGNIIYEPHGVYDFEKRGELFLEYPITHFYGLIKYFMEFKSLINSSYEPLFEPVIVDGDDEDVQDEYDPDEQEEIKREETFKKWAWESVLHKLSDGDITKYDRITELPVIFIFNQLGFRKEMDL